MTRDDADLNNYLCADGTQASVPANYYPKRARWLSLSKPYNCGMLQNRRFFVCYSCN
jgi:hypothetical protein